MGSKTNPVIIKLCANDTCHVPVSPETTESNSEREDSNNVLLSPSSNAAKPILDLSPKKISNKKQSSKGTSSKISDRLQTVLQDRKYPKPVSSPKKKALDITNSSITQSPKTDGTPKKKTAGNSIAKQHSPKTFSPSRKKTAISNTAKEHSPKTVSNSKRKTVDIINSDLIEEQSPRTVSTRKKRTLDITDDNVIKEQSSKVISPRKRKTFDVTSSNTTKEESPKAAHTCKKRTLDISNVNTKKEQSPKKRNTREKRTLKSSDKTTKEQSPKQVLTPKKKNPDVKCGKMINDETQKLALHFSDKLHAVLEENKFTNELSACKKKTPVVANRNITKEKSKKLALPCSTSELHVALPERKYPKAVSPRKKSTLDVTAGSTTKANCQRQSLISHLSKLRDKKLDIVHGGDESEIVKLENPPLVMQPSNLDSVHVLDVKHDGGGIETSASFHSMALCSSDLSSCQDSKESLYQESDIEPPKKKIKCKKDNIEVTVCNKLEDEHTSKEAATKLLKTPLVMQTSNLLENVLDVGHDGGGKKTSKFLKSSVSKVSFELNSEISQSKKKSTRSEMNSECIIKEAFVNKNRETKSDRSLETGKQSDLSLGGMLKIACNENKINLVELQNTPLLLKNDSEQLNAAITLKNEAESFKLTAILKNEASNDASDINSTETVEDKEFCKNSSDILVVQESLSEDSYNNQMDSQNGNEDSAMEFDILDEFESNDNDLEEMNSDEDDDSEISADEIDAMLDEGLGDYAKQNGINGDLQHEERQKVILKIRGRDHFEVLPEGWIEVTHNSGMPIYLHKQSRVCSVSKPYFLGPGSTRKHEIPITAIPCLHYFKQLEKEKENADCVKEESNTSENKCPINDSESKDEVSENKNGFSKDSVQANGLKCESSKNKIKISEDKNDKTQINNISDTSKAANLIFPSAKLESVKDNKVTGSLDYLAVREYCQKRFEFQTITVKRFKTWFGRRKHQKQLKRKQRPFLPDSTQLITCPLPPSADKSTTVGNASKREFIMNPTGKSPVCILHEYVQHTLRVQPRYVFKELESASTPYGAVVLINDMEYGCGYGSSKKVAKSDAAKNALEILIPKIKTFAPEKNSDDDELQDVEFFDQVRVEDPRVTELSVKAGQPYPYQILLECLKRNYGMGDTEVNIEMNNLKHQKNEFIMKVGKHNATVVCKNKRDGKHRASQAILQQLHPHIISWGSLLRMYGKGSCKTLKEKKEEEQRITELQSKACVNKPNMSILNKLKEEMLKYREKMKSKKPIGKLIPERMKLVTVSGSNLKSIEL